MGSSRLSHVRLYLEVSPLIEPKGKPEGSAVGID